MSEATDAPKLTLAPTRPKRGGWYSPVRPGPERHVLVGAIVAGVVALVVWLVFGIEALHSHGGAKATRTLSIDDSGQLRQGNAPATAPKEYRGTQGALRYAVVRGDVRMPDSVSRLRIELDLPAGVDPSTVVLRARTPEAVVDLRRTEDDVEAPYVDVTRVRSGSIDVDVLIAVPSSGLLVGEDGGDDAPKLATATKPYDDHVVDESASGRRLAQLHTRAVPLALLAAFLGMVVPVVLVVLLRRRWYQPVPATPAGGTRPAGPPGSRATVAAAAITRGSRGVSVPDTFAGQVLDLVSRDAVKLRHTLDPRTGEGSVIGIGTALGTEEDASSAPDPSTLDGAALLLLAAVANDEGDTVQLPDRPERLSEQLAQTGANRGQLDQARAGWRTTLERHLTEYAIVEHPRTRYLAAVALGCALVLVVSVAIGLISDLDGTAASAWFAAAALIAPTVILAAMVNEQRGWTRVRAKHQAERLRWLAWRGVLDDAESSGSVDVRVLPYAVASGNAAGIAPRRAGPTDVGLAAATPELITGLRRIAGATD